MKAYRATRKEKRRCCQFSLASLLLLVVLVSCVLSWFASRITDARQQRHAVAQVADLGGFVWYDYQCNDYGVPDFALRAPEPFWAREILDEDFFHSAVGVSFAGLRFTADAGSIAYERITVRDTDLVCLRDLRKLQELDLRGNEITDTGLAHIAHLAGLKRLLLADTEITDAGLEHLERLTSLSYLDLQRTEVTNHGVMQLQQCLPETHILH